MRFPILVQSLVLVLLLVLSCACLAQPRGRRTFDLSELLISLPDVQRELNISSRQTELLEAAREDMSSQVRSRRRGRRNSEERSQRRVVAEKLRNVILEEEQSKRFRQVRLQFEGLYAIDNKDFAKDLKLTDQQVSEIERLRTADDPINALDRLENVIDDSQLDKWQESLGKEFGFNDDMLQYRRFYLARRGGDFRRRSSDQEGRSERPESE